MPHIEFVKRSPIEETYRVAKVKGMFNVPDKSESEFRVSVNLDIENTQWKVGLITGASGSGKSSIAQELFPNEYDNDLSSMWASASLVDDFPKNMKPKQIAEILTSVGLSSVPSWLLPYKALSTGQQFRADLALAMSQSNELIVFDEFTSTIDRTVAAAASAAISKFVRRSEKQFVAVTCHKDVEQWLEPDWVLDMDTGLVSWECKQRPKITLEIREGLREAWHIFAKHHYLTGNLSPSSRVFLAFASLNDGEERLVGFFSFLPSMGNKGWRRDHRIVVLPDFQGLGIGNAMVEACAEYLWVSERLRFRSVVSTPAFINHRLKRKDMWRLARKPSRVPHMGRTGIRSKSKNRATNTSENRLTTSWVYIPEELRKKNE